MGEIKLFRIGSDAVEELMGESIAIEKSLQSLLENNLPSFLNIRLVATEYPTGKTHGGRIDTLGLDDRNHPVIIEYKRALNENVINQVLYYFDWLMDHQAEFERLVGRKLGADASDHVDWSGPRLVCIAGDFSTYDQHAVQQIPRSIELVRYRRYRDQLFLFEFITSSKSTPPSSAKPGGARLSQGSGDRLFRVTSLGMQEKSRRKETYESIVDGMLLADFKGDKGDLAKLLRNGQVKRGTE